MNTRKGRRGPETKNDTPIKDIVLPSSSNSSKKTLFTPCRRLGLGRRRVTQNSPVTTQNSPDINATPISSTSEEKTDVSPPLQSSPSTSTANEEKPKSTTSRRKKSSRPLKRTFDDSEKSLEGNSTFTVLISPNNKKRKLELVNIFNSDNIKDLPENVKNFSSDNLTNNLKSKVISDNITDIKPSNSPKRDSKHNAKSNSKIKNTSLKVSIPIGSDNKVLSTSRSSEKINSSNEKETKPLVNPKISKSKRGLNNACKEDVTVNDINESSHKSLEMISPNTKFKRKKTDMVDNKTECDIEKLNEKKIDVLPINVKLSKKKENNNKKTDGKEKIIGSSDLNFNNMNEVVQSIESNSKNKEIITSKKKKATTRSAKKEVRSCNTNEYLETNLNTASSEKNISVINSTNDTNWEKTRQVPNIPEISKSEFNEENKPIKKRKVVENFENPLQNKGDEDLEELLPCTNIITSLNNESLTNQPTVNTESEKKNNVRETSTERKKSTRKGSKKNTRKTKLSPNIDKKSTIVSSVNPKSVITANANNFNDDFDDDFRNFTPRTRNKITIKNKTIIDTKYAEKTSRTKQKMDYSEFISSEESVDSDKNSDIGKKITEVINVTENANSFLSNDKTMDDKSEFIKLDSSITLVTSSDSEDSIPLILRKHKKRNTKNKANFTDKVHENLEDLNDAVDESSKKSEVENIVTMEEVHEQLTTDIFSDVETIIPSENIMDKNLTSYEEVTNLIVIPDENILTVEENVLIVEENIVTEEESTLMVEENILEICVNSEQSVNTNTINLEENNMSSKIESNEEHYKAPVETNENENSNISISENISPLIQKLINEHNQDKESIKNDSVYDFCSDSNEKILLPDIRSRRKLDATIVEYSESSSNYTTPSFSPIEDRQSELRDYVIEFQTQMNKKNLSEKSIEGENSLTMYDSNPYMDKKHENNPTINKNVETDTKDKEVINLNEENDSLLKDNANISTSLDSVNICMVNDNCNTSEINDDVDISITNDSINTNASNNENNTAIIEDNIKCQECMQEAVENNQLIEINHQEKINDSMLPSSNDEVPKNGQEKDNQVLHNKVEENIIEIKNIECDILTNSIRDIPVRHVTEKIKMVDSIEEINKLDNNPPYDRVVISFQKESANKRINTRSRQKNLMSLSLKTNRVVRSENDFTNWQPKVVLFRLNADVFNNEENRTTQNVEKLNMLNKKEKQTKKDNLLKRKERNSNEFGEKTVFNDGLLQEIDEDERRERVGYKINSNKAITRTILESPNRTHLESPSMKQGTKLKNRPIVYTNLNESRNECNLIISKIEVIEDDDDDDDFRKIKSPKIITKKIKDKRLINRELKIREESVFFTPPSSRSENDSDSNRNDYQTESDLSPSSSNTNPYGEGTSKPINLSNLSVTNLTEIIGIAPSKSPKIFSSKLIDNISEDTVSKEDKEVEDIIPKTPSRKSSIHSRKRKTSRSSLSNLSQKTNVTNATFGFNTDSDDDFQAPHLLTKDMSTKKDIKDESGKKSKIKTLLKKSAGDILNKTETYRISKTSAITAVNKGLVASYIKSYDNDLNMKTTESDDSQTETVRNFRPDSIIVEQHSYTPYERNTSMFDFVIDDPDTYLKNQEKPINPRENLELTRSDIKKQLLETEIRIKEKQAKLERLKLISIYKRTHDLDQLQKDTLQMKKGCQEALLELAAVLRQTSYTPFDMATLLHNMHIPNEVVGYNVELDEFT